jgi:hypothetical protein
MNNNFITKTRVKLIQIGKIAPFVVCFVVFISYTEDVYSLMFDRYVEFSDGVYLRKDLSWFIGNYFKYDLATLSFLVVLSCAIETCIYNKLACLYLSINLLEKSYFDFELEPTYIYIICLANIIVAGYLTVKGVQILINKH